MKISISYPYPKTIENEKVQSSTVNLIILSVYFVFWEFILPKFASGRNITPQCFTATFSFFVKGP